MIDTIRVLIPLTEGQWRKVLRATEVEDRWQFALFNGKSGELYLRRIRGLVNQVDSSNANGGRGKRVSLPSYTRDLSFDIPPHWREGETALTLEFSLPKFWYGHNISLLYDYRAALGELRRVLQRAFNFRSLPPIDSWLVHRVDFCYAWQLPTQESAQAVINAIKRMRVPYKREPQIRPNSILWPGSTYSLKFYLKLPEFQSNDLKKLISAKADPRWIDHWEAKAQGVLRFEITGRHRWLKRIGVNTVADLAGQSRSLSVSSELLTWARDVAKSHRQEFTKRTGQLDSEVDETYVLTWVLSIAASQGYIPQTEDKKGFILDHGQVIEFPEIVLEKSDNTEGLTIPAGRIEISIKPKIDDILQTYLFKCVGSGDMGMIDRVKESLFQTYSSTKASRLLGFWTLVQRVGAQEVRAMMGSNAYYRDMRNLKKAGVTIVETTDNLVKVDSDFFSNFKITVPSPFVVNKVDDFRDSENLLNLQDYRDKKTS